MNKESPKMPALFIHALARVGYRELPAVIQGNYNLLPCSRSLPNEHMDEFSPSFDRIIDPRVDPKPVCTDENRICAMYGVRFFGCICDVLPVRDRNLATIQKDCYFTIDDLEVMSNSHKRNMVFWWYATNAYGIAGKGCIEKLPECLEYAIRDTYPNPDGVPYTGNKKYRQEN